VISSTIAHYRVLSSLGAGSAVRGGSLRRERARARRSRGNDWENRPTAMRRRAVPDPRRGAGEAVENWRRESVIRTRGECRARTKRPRIRSARGAESGAAAPV